MSQPLKISFIIGGEILFFTLYINVANFCMFLSCIVTDLSFSNNSEKVDFSSLYVKRSALSCSLFILLLSVLLWNIHVSGQ